MKNIWRYILAIVALIAGLYIILTVAAMAVKVVFALITIGFIFLVLKASNESDNTKGVI